MAVERKPSLSPRFLRSRLAHKYTRWATSPGLRHTQHFDRQCVYEQMKTPCPVSLTLLGNMKQC